MSTDILDIFAIPIADTIAISAWKIAHVEPLRIGVTTV